MISSLPNYRPSFSSFRHVPPRENFVKLANLVCRHGNGGRRRRNVYLLKIGAKSLGDGSRDICKDTESNLGPVTGF